MNHEHIRQLVKMADEIEALEASDLADVPQPISFKDAAARFQAQNQLPPVSLRRRAVAPLAIAACLAIAGSSVWQAIRPAPVIPARVAQVPSPRSAIRPAAPPAAPIHAAHDAAHVQPSHLIAAEIPVASLPVSTSPQCDEVDHHFASMVYAITLEQDTGCSSRRRVFHQFAQGDSADAVSRAELLRVGFENSGIASPDRILVLVVSGPVEMIGHMDDEVAQLASCIDMRNADPETTELVGELGHDEAKYAAAAKTCLTEGLAVEAATLLLGR